VCADSWPFAAARNVEVLVAMPRPTLPLLACEQCRRCERQRARRRWGSAAQPPQRFGADRVTRPLFRWISTADE
jgi:hypothetical protein